MALKVETFSNIKGGNAFFKAVTHPETAAAASALVARLLAARSVALIDPQGFAEGFLALFGLGALAIQDVYVQSVEAIGLDRLGHAARPLTELARADIDLVFIVGFDTERMAGQIAHLVPGSAELVSLDAMRLDAARLSNRGQYLDPINFATNFAFFRDKAGHHTRLVTANYWANYGASTATAWLRLFDASGNLLAAWHEALGPADSAISIDSRDVRKRFALPEFEGQLFVHICGVAGHDVVKYALDTWSDKDGSLSCTHDANAWPADYYAGLPAPNDGERVLLWVQNSLPVAIPAGGVSLNIMGDERSVPLATAIPPFATLPLDVATLLPGVTWPQQIEIDAGRYVVRPRYEIEHAGLRRIAHPNVERTDLRPDPAIAGLGKRLGKGFILPAPILPPGGWRSALLPTPMARTQAHLPVQATAYDPQGREIGRFAFGNLARNHATALDLDRLVGAADIPWGHVELTYDFDMGSEADGWLHALFRYENRTSGHQAETSFGAHIFNTILTWRDEPQSYIGRPPGLSTRLFLRLGPSPFDSFCHLIYPASLPWHAHSQTDLFLIDGDGTRVAERQVQIACGGSLLWRYSEMFSTAERAQAGERPHILIRDRTCRLFGYHGLSAAGGRFSLDHMFGF